MITSKVEIESVIYDYEQMLIGNADSFNIDDYREQNDKKKSMMALALIKYVSETYLEWTPEMMCDSLTTEVLKQWKLDGLIKRIKFPEEIKLLNEEVHYIAHMIYPEIIDINIRDIYIAVYEKGLKYGYEFLDEFFMSGDGAEKVIVCLKYAIEKHLSFDSIEEMYDYFGSKRCSVFLEKTTLLGPYIKIFFDCYLDALHCMLAPFQRDNLKHQLLRFHQLLDDKISRNNIENEKVEEPEEKNELRAMYSKIIDEAIARYNASNEL